MVAIGDLPMNLDIRAVRVSDHVLYGPNSDRNDAADGTKAPVYPTQPAPGKEEDSIGVGRNFDSADFLSSPPALMSKNLIPLAVVLHEAPADSRWSSLCCCLHVFS